MLSVVYITFNAERYLAQSLERSRLLTDDLVIIDSGSTDQTLTIAYAAQAKIIRQEWLGFAAQKQLAINSARYDWVLFLDADEILSTEAVQEIQNLSTQLSTGCEYVAFSLPRRNWFQGKWIQHGSWWPDRVVRLVNRTLGQMKPVPVHECWQTEGPIQALKSPLEHYSYANFSELIHKADRYSTLAAKQLFQAGKRVSTWSPLWHSMAAFIRLFILKQGFRDGIEGAAIAYTTALASFMKYAKLQELWRNTNS
ncbi:glycosyltransferase family 2 protein [Thiofilum flexile]|uniref:glycosyltransferase family 2 protein n=1 Tax=Thiofilum flexile TaxID=125627 RepID=UPI0003734BCD|nr:glycosyltransferase family 2 protein [Thiofilum flexile]